MPKLARPAVASALFVALVTAGVATAGTASAAPTAGLPDLTISANRTSCTVTVTNRGPVTAIDAAVFISNYGGITSTPEDIAPGGVRKIHYLDCNGLPALTYTYDTNGDSNPFNNVTFL